MTTANSVQIPLSKHPNYSLAAAASALAVEVRWIGAEGCAAFGDVKGEVETMCAIAALSTADERSLPFDCGGFNLKASFAEVSQLLHIVESHLVERTFLSVNDQFGYNDALVWGAIRSNPAAYGRARKCLDALPSLFSWFARVEKLPAIQSVVIGANKARSSTDRSTTSKRAENIKAELRNAEVGRVVLRFAPEPSGYLHIGHLKAAILNRYFADKYNGKLILRFDDTNPLKEERAFEETIKEDLAMIEVAYDKVVHTSDHFDSIAEYAERLIQQGDAFMDGTDAELIKEQRNAFVPSQNRDADVAQNLSRFRCLREGHPGFQTWVLRAKIDYQHKNGAMRDPVIFRSYNAYPTYDLACPLIDHIDGVTHALRANEYAQHHEQYAWFLRKLSLRSIEIFDFSRIDFVYTVLSKRKLKYLVENNVVAGWDDPRFPTVRGIRARGMTIRGIKDYIAGQGASQKTLQLEWDSIWTVNKRVIDPTAPRYWAIAEEAIVTVTVEGRDTDHQCTEIRPLHKKNPQVGTKALVFSSTILMEQADAKSFVLGEEITCMDWGNAFVAGRSFDRRDTEAVSSMTIKLNPGGDYKTTAKKVTWLAAPTKAFPLIPVVLIEYDYLITKKRLEDNDDLENVVNPRTEYRVNALASAEVVNLERWDIIQFERKGFYIFQGTKDVQGRLEFGYIPDGRAESIALKALPAVIHPPTTIASQGGQTAVSDLPQ